MLEVFVRNPKVEKNLLKYEFKNENKRYSCNH